MRLRAKLLAVRFRNRRAALWIAMRIMPHRMHAKAALNRGQAPARFSLDFRWIYTGFTPDFHENVP